MASQVEIDRLNQFGFDDEPGNCRDCEFCFSGEPAFGLVREESLRNELESRFGICATVDPCLVELDGKGCA